MDAILEQLLAQRRLINQAARLRLDLRKAGREPGVYGSERYTRIQDIIRRHDDRIDRRQWVYDRISSGKPVVTTVQVAQWIGKHYSRYAVLGGVDSTEVAGDVCQALDLWDKYGSIPMWVYRISESTCIRLEAEAMHSRNFFVEKVINYEPDGQVLWA